MGAVGLGRGWGGGGKGLGGRGWGEGLGGRGVTIAGIRGRPREHTGSRDAVAVAYLAGSVLEEAEEGNDILEEVGEGGRALCQVQRVPQRALLFLLPAAV
jgi:hypothetical protein